MLFKKKKIQLLNSFFKIIGLYFKCFIIVCSASYWVIKKKQYKELGEGTFGSNTHPWLHDGSSPFSIWHQEVRLASCSCGGHRTRVPTHSIEPPTPHFPSGLAGAQRKVHYIPASSISSAATVPGDQNMGLQEAIS